MKSSCSVVSAVLACGVIAACAAASPLEMKHADGDTAETKLDKLDARLDKLISRLDKLEGNVARTNDILEHHPAAASSTPEFDNGRLDRAEAQVDKVIRVLKAVMPVPEPDADGTYAVPIGKADPIQGPADAKVTIVEGFEFLCPFCAKVNPTVDQILAKYPGDVRLVSKYLIIHGPNAILPAMAACAAAKQGKFKEMKAALWAALFKEEDGNPARVKDKLDPEDLDPLAKAAGTDLDKLRVDMMGSECKSWIEDSEGVMKTFGASSTPAFFINGRYIGGAMPFENFDALIQEELAKANDKIKGGVAQADYYQQEILDKGQKTVKGPLDD